METKLKKLLPVAGVFCSLFASLNAAESTQHGSSSMMHHQNTDETRFREITPNAGPRVTNGADVFLTADFIYWTARQDGLSYAFTGADTTISPSEVSVSTKGKTYYPGTKFSPGFKVGAGLNLGHDGWDVFLEYTWFHSGKSKLDKSGTEVDQRLIPVGTPRFAEHSRTDSFEVDLLSFDTIESFWKMRFNNFDLELGRNFYVSQYLTLRPHIGLKGNWYTQSLNLTYTAPRIGDTPFDFGYDYTDIEQVKSDNKQKWWGVGVRTGIDTAWYFDKNWSIFGDFALSTLWGRFNTSQIDYDRGSINQQEIQNSVILYKTNEFHSVKGVAEMQLGLRFDYWFSDDDYHFGLSGAWEEQLWINQGQLGDTGGGDLGFQGFTLKARFDF